MSDNTEQPKEQPAKAPRPPVVFEQKGGLVPKTFDEAFRMATIFSASGLVPKAYLDKPEACFVAMQMGAELGIPPLQSLQNIAVINGKPGIYGDLGKALLLQAGCLIDEDDMDAIQKSGKGRCRIIRPGRQPVERTFSVENAKTAGLWNKEGPWKNYPFRQLAWRAFWFAARDAAADLLRGMKGAEELIDTPVEHEVSGTATFVEQPRRVSDPEKESAQQNPASASSGTATPPASQSSAVVDPTPATESVQTSSPSTSGKDTATTSTCTTQEQPAASASKEKRLQQMDDDLPWQDDPMEGEVMPREDEAPVAAKAPAAPLTGPKITQPQINILMKRLEGAALTTVDLQAKFGCGIQDLFASQFNTVVGWCKEPR